MPIGIPVSTLHLARTEAKALSTRSRAMLALAVLLGSLAAWSSSKAQQPVNVPERSYNAFRTGANTSETILTPQNVRSSANQFHKRYAMSVDGKIEGSPLYLSSVTIGGGTHNVLYVLLSMVKHVVTG